jgi:Transglycosylase SLT domain
MGGGFRFLPHMMRAAFRPSLFRGGVGSTPFLQSPGEGECNPFNSMGVNQLSPLCNSLNSQNGCQNGMMNMLVQLLTQCLLIQQLGTMIQSLQSLSQNGSGNNAQACSEDDGDAEASECGGGDYKAYAQQVAQKYGLDPNIFCRMIQQESGWNPNANSGKACGIAQFTPDTAAQFGIDPHNPYQSLDAAGKYLRQNLDKFGGSYAKALAAYNAGPGAVCKYGGVPPYQETQNYVSKILGNSCYA